MSSRTIGRVTIVYLIMVLKSAEQLLDLLERYGPQRREQRLICRSCLKGDGFWNCKTRNSAQPAVAASHLNVNSLNIMLLVGLMPSISRW